MKLHSDLKSLTGTGGHTLAWLLILLVTCTFPLNAQKSSAKADAETLKLINGADDSKGKQSGALIVLKDYRMTINKGLAPLLSGSLVKFTQKRQWEHIRRFRWDLIHTVKMLTSIWPA